MNALHRLVWNDFHHAWVPTLLCVALAAAGPARAQLPPPATALPSGGRVNAGQAQIGQIGAAMTIQQGSARAAIDWQSFDIGRDAQVQFQQPSAQSVTLNRVQGPDASQIFGRITANGQVFLSNPNGVYFAPGASVEVGGLVATTHRIGLDDFMAGRARFERQGPSGSVVNAGELRAALGGYIALLAPEVRNQGVIVANLGTVALAAGEAFELKFDASQSLAGLRVEPSTVQALVDNRSAVLAPGGLVILSAQALDRVQGGVIRNSGRVEATGLAQRGGRIVLDASSQIANSGNIDASATADGPAGSVRLLAPEVVNSGSIEARGSAEHPAGGHVDIVAGRFTQTGSGVVDASAPLQGGSVLIRASGAVALAGRVAVQATLDVPAPRPVPSPVDAATTAAASASGSTPATAPQAPGPDTPPQGGSITVQAAQVTLPSATLDASGARGGRIVLDASAPAPAAPPAPSPAPEPGKVALLGNTQLSSRGRRGAGGTTTVLGDTLALQDHTALDASGSTAGGTVRVGGGWQGGEGLHQAITVTMAEHVLIDASAAQQGDGGSVVLWSDVSRVGGHTQVDGRILARGGAVGGNGGQVETSGHRIDAGAARVDAGARAGQGGLWLIDPYNYTIGGAQATSIAGTLNTGTSVTVVTSANNASQGSSGNSGDAGIITVGSTIAKTAGGDATLTLQAHGDIVFNGGSGVSASAGRLNLVLISDWDSAAGGAIYFNGAGTPITLASNGGQVWMGGNGYATAFGTATWNGLAVGTGLANSSATSTVWEGVHLNRTTVNTAGGNLFIAGHNARYNSGEARYGVKIDNSTSLDTGAGSIEIHGTLQPLSGALAVYPDLFGVDISRSSLSTTSGAIAITGGEAANGDSGNTSGIGVRLYNASVIAASGAIAITGTTGTNNGAGGAREGLHLFAEGDDARVTVSTTSGAITLTGTSNVQDQANSSGIGLRTAKVANTDASNPAVKVSSLTGHVVLVGDNPANINTSSSGIHFNGANFGRFYIGQGESSTHSGNLTLTGRAVTGANMAAGALRLLGSGALTVQPVGTSFVRGAATSAPVVFDGVWSVGSSHSAFTLGKAGNAAGITVSIPLSVAGPIALYGGNLVLNAGLGSTLAGAGISVLASGSITTNNAVTLTTNGGGLLLATDTDGTGGGIFNATGNFSASTSGGAITLGGGDASASGYATGSAPGNTDANGIRFRGTSTFNSGGGNISLRGKSFNSGGNGAHAASGLWFDGSTSIDSGTGTVLLEGVSQAASTNDYTMGMLFGFIGGSTTTSITSANTTANAIRVVGSAATAGHAAYNSGIRFFSNGTSITATGLGGGITLQGTRNTAGNVFDFSFADSTGAGTTSSILANSGPIHLNGTTVGGHIMVGTMTLGRKAGTAVTSSSSDVTITADGLNTILAGTAVHTSGTLTVQPAGNDFDSTLNWPATNLALSSDVSGLTLGRDVPGVAKTDTIHINAPQTIAGPIAVYGGAVNVNAALTAAGDITLVSSGADADLLINVPITSTAAGTTSLLLKSARNVSLAAGGSITAGSGPLNTHFWADSDRTGDGIIRLLSNIDTHGGWLKFGNNESATINGVSTRVGGDVFINGSGAQTIGTGGGQFDLFGEAILANTAGLTIATAGGDVNFYGVLNSGNTYTYVDKTGIAGSGSWTAARTEARNGTAGGAATGDSYLATITSRLENALASLAAGYKGAWIGAWRPSPTSSYAWTWADGADAGQNFFTQTTGGSGGSVVSGRFHNFASVEPNGTLSGDESVAQFFGTAGRWNDLPATTVYSPSSATSQYAVMGFVRETNLANSPLSINAGAGRVTIDGAVGGSKALASLNVQAASTTIHGGTLLTTGAQSYSNALSVLSSGDLTVGATTLTVANANQAALFKAAGSVTLNPGLSIRTNNGDLTIWSDSDASGAGNIMLGAGTTLNTANGATSQSSGGGRITLAGGLDDGAATVTSGRTAGDGRPDGYAVAATTASSDETGAGVSIGTGSSLYAGGGDVFIAGQGTNSTAGGVQTSGIWFWSGLIDAGSGKLALYGRNVATNNANNANAFGIHLNTSSLDNTMTELISASTAADAITLVGDSSAGTTTGSSGLVAFFSNAGGAGTRIAATHGGGITLTGKGSTGPNATGTGALGDGIDLNFAQVLSTGGPITLSGTGGPYGISLGGRNRANNVVRLGQAAGVVVNSQSLAASTSNVVLNADSLRVNSGASSGWVGQVATSGALTVQPINTSFASGLVWAMTQLTVTPTLSGLTLGKAGNTADITIAGATSVNGPISLHGGNLLIDAGLTATGSTITLQGTGNVSDGASGFVSATNLRLLGGNVVLDSASTSIGTLAASGVGSLEVRNSGALTIGTVGGSSGISATGTVAVSTQSGDLTLAGPVTTGDASTSAIMLNAGRAAVAGTATGGDLIVSGSPALTTGAGGRATLYSGSVAGSTGLGALVGSGSGRFRYGSDESASGFSAPLGTGLHAIYRERPTVALAWNDQTVAYGTAPAAFGYTVTSGTLHHGDAPSAAMGGSVLSGAGHLAVSGAPYALVDSGALQALGYNATVAAGAITVTPRTLSASYTGVDKVYDGGTATTVSSADNRFGGDVLTLSASAAFADKHAGIGKAVNVSGVGLAGADAANYTVATTGSTTATITRRTLTPMFAGVDKAYDGTTAATVTASDDRVVGDILTVQGSASFTDRHVGTGKTVNVAGVGATGSDAGNYTVAVATASTTADITPRPLAVSFAGVGKVYDGTTAATVDTQDDRVAGDLFAINRSAAFGDADAAPAKAVGVSGVGLTGADAGNYTVAAAGSATASITPKPITLSATKVYDGTTTLGGGVVSFGGLVGSETLGYSGATASDANVASTDKFVDALTLADGANGGRAANYQVAGLDVAHAPVTITPRPVSVTGATVADKVYDGTTSATLVQAGQALTGIGSQTLGLTATGAAFDTPDAGSGKAVTVNGYALADGANGGVASNYQLAGNTATTAADIGRAPLTVVANHDAKFVTQADVAGYNGVAYTGFVHGETAAVISGTATVARSNAGTEGAGPYAGVLVPDTTGLWSANYTFLARHGDYTIVPSNQLLVRVAHSVDPYGTAPVHSIASAQYFNGASVVDLAGVTALGGNRFTVSDGAGGSATLTLTPMGAPVSTGGWTGVGAWQLGAGTVTTQNAANFSNTVTVAGSATVLARGLTASAAGGVTKVYDGTTAMPAVSLQLAGVLAGDALSTSARGAFASRNAGSNLAYTVDGVTLAGADAANYYLSGGSRFSGSNGSITPRPLAVTYGGVHKVYDGNTVAGFTSSDDRIAGDVFSISAAAAFADKNVGRGKLVSISGALLSGGDAGNYTLASGGQAVADITRLGSVTWTGGATGHWFDPANWAGGAVPDLANVAGVVVPAGVTVTFDTAGAVAPAQTGPVQIDSLGASGGGLLQKDGVLDVGSGGVALGGLTQHGGSLASMGSIVVDNFTQTGGATATSGDLTVNGNFSQGSAGTVTVQGDARITDSTGGATVGNLQSGGDLAITSTDGDIAQAPGSAIVVEGTTTVDAGTNDVKLDGAGNDFSGPFNARGGDITVVDGTGGLVIGNIDASGKFDATSTGGGITQAPGSAIVVDGSTTVNAGTNDVKLDGPGNEFSGPFNASGGDITVVDNTGGLVIGNIDAGGGFGATSTGGSITQFPGSAIVVDGATTVDAGTNDVKLDGPSNDFSGPFNASGRDITVMDGTGGLVIGNLDASGKFDAASTGGSITQRPGSVIVVDGSTTVNAGTNDVKLDGTANDFKGPLNATGRDIAVVDGTGGLVLGRIDAGGNFDAATRGGSITQQPGSAIAVGGATTVNGTPTAAGANDIRLDGPGNDFSGTFNANGADIRVVDSAGGLKLGDITATGRLDATSAGGDVTQAAGTRLDVGGAAVLAAPDGVIRLAANGNRFGDTLALQAGDAPAVQEGSILRPAAAPVLVTPSLESAPPLLSETGRFGSVIMVAAPQAAASTGFSFALPQSLVEALPPNTPIRAALEDGSPLPDWLQFVPERRLFRSAAVPSGGLPLTVAVTIRGVRTLVRVVAVN